MENNTSHILYFEWASLMPDLRDYKPSSPLLYPKNIEIAVEVPEEFVAIKDENRQVLTLDGMRFVVDKFESVMGKKIDVKSEVEDEDWENWDNDDKLSSDNKFEDNDEEWE
jgi:hypothetical protein